MERRKPLRVDPAKVRAWQQRSAEAYAARRRATKPTARSGLPPTQDRVDQTPTKPFYDKGRRKGRTRRNDSAWRAACIEVYGEWCRACGTSREVQMDHMKPRSQQGRSDVENGLPLCRAHHEQKTAGTLQIRPEWLTEQQVEYLSRIGWVEWDDDGQPRGEGWRHFAARKARDD